MNDQEIIHLSYLIHIGEITQPQPKHDNYSDYGLTRSQSINSRIRYLRPLKDQAEKSVRILTIAMMNATGTARDLAILMLVDANKILDDINKEIKYNLSRLKFKDDIPTGYDIHQIKQIPMDQITKVLPNGFFITNPFRNEHSPSNSLHWDKRSNRYKDFATDAHGDVIDLYMAVNKVDLKTALKELSNM
jgi:hypothetical protein